MRRNLITLTLLALCTGVAAQADTTYYYTGQNFTSGDTSSSLTGQISLASPFGDNLNEAYFSPLSFTFTDGDFTMDASTTVYANWQISTNATGTITNWNIWLEGGPAGSGEYTYEMTIENDPGYAVGDLGDGQATFTGPFYDNENHVPGSFSTTPHTIETVPEPASMSLLMIGVCGVLFGLARRRTRVRL